MVKCLASEAAVESIDEVLNELDHLRSAFKMIAGFLTNEEYLEHCGAGEAMGPIMDQGMMLALANDRLERLTKAGHELAFREKALPLNPADQHGEA